MVVQWLFKCCATVFEGFSMVFKVGLSRVFNGFQLFSRVVQGFSGENLVNLVKQLGCYANFLARLLGKNALDLQNIL